MIAMLAATAASRCQTPLSELVGNNTSACPAKGPLPKHCLQHYAGQLDDRPGVATPLYDPPPGNVSEDDPHKYMRQGEKTRIFANFMIGYCVTPHTLLCNGNVQVGYQAGDATTVAAQVDALKRRKIDGAILTWNGSGHDEPTLAFQQYLNRKYCRDGVCDLKYIVMFDDGSLGYPQVATGVPTTSGEGCLGKDGEAYANCVVAHLKNEVCYLNGKYWGDPAYEKADGRPIMMVFPYESVIPAEGSHVSWASVWAQLDLWNRDLPKNCGKAPYNANNGVPLLVFENDGGFTHVGSSGSFYWVKPQGTSPARDQGVDNISPANMVGTLDNFLTVGEKHSRAQVWGGAFKGFNSSHSPWGTNRIMDQQCGQVWLRSLTEGNRFAGGTGLRYVQIATWNDYNEGTDIEAGIDNCYSVSGSVLDDTLNWTVNPLKPQASLTTISEIRVYDSTDGSTLTALRSELPAVSGKVDLKGLSRGKHLLYVQMVGKNSILNQMSPGIEYHRK